MATKKEEVLKKMDRSKLREYLLVGNSPEDLANLLIDKLSAMELYEIQSSEAFKKLSEK